MINPGGSEFNEDIPITPATQLGPDFRESVSEKAGEVWEQTKEKAGVARERTEIFVRENPIPTLLGALGLGIVIGLAIRYASNSRDREDEVKESASKAWSFLSLPFFWPMMKTVKEKAGESADAVMEGVDRLKKVDVARYTEPIKKDLRKRWKSWTR